MTKIEAIGLLASMADDDPRLRAVESALSGNPAPAERPASLRLFNMGEACKVLGTSRATLWRMIRDGRCRTVEVRRNSHRVPESELQRIVGG